MPLTSVEQFCDRVSCKAQHNGQNAKKITGGFQLFIIIYNHKSYHNVLLKDLRSKITLFFLPSRVNYLPN